LALDIIVFIHVHLVGLFFVLVRINVFKSSFVFDPLAPSDIISINFSFEGSWISKKFSRKALRCSPIAAVPNNNQLTSCRCRSGDADLSNLVGLYIHKWAVHFTSYSIKLFLLLYVLYKYSLYLLHEYNICSEYDDTSIGTMCHYFSGASRMMIVLTDVRYICSVVCGSRQNKINTFREY